MGHVSTGSQFGDFSEKSLVNITENLYSPAFYVEIIVVLKGFGNAGKS